MKTISCINLLVEIKRKLEQSIILNEDEERTLADECQVEVDLVTEKFIFDNRLKKYVVCIESAKRNRVYFCVKPGTFKKYICPRIGNIKDGYIGYATR